MFTDVEVGVVVSDTFGRGWRRAHRRPIGCAGVATLVDLRGTKDTHERELW